MGLPGISHTLSPFGAGCTSSVQQEARSLQSPPAQQEGAQEELVLTQDRRKKQNKTHKLPKRGGQGSVCWQLTPLIHTESYSEQSEKKPLD